MLTQPKKIRTMKIYEQKITYNPKILGGKPIIQGTRISVEFILELLSSGMTPQEVTEEYAQLSRP